MTRRRIELLLIAGMLGAPAVLAALRHARQVESVTALRDVALGHTRASFRGAASWNGIWPSKRVTFRHDAESGRTAYWFSGPFHREFVLAEPSHRMPDPTAWCIDPEALVENYRARELAPRTFLDRPVRVLRITPRHAGRPTVEVWVDTASGLPVRASTFRADGSLYRVCKFERISFGPEPVEPVDLQRAHRYAGTPVSLANPQAAAGFEPLFPDYLPVGFRLVEARVKQAVTPELTLVYSDGVTAFDLRQSPRPTPGALEEFHEEHRPPWGGMPGFGSKRGGPWGRDAKNSRDSKDSKDSPEPRETETRERFPGPGKPEHVSSWTKKMLAWHERRARERLVRSEVGGATATKRTRGFHVSWDLEVEDLSVTLTARSDLDDAEMERVLESLHR